MLTDTSSSVSDSETPDLVAEELGGNIPEADAGWAHSLYEGLAKAAAIDQYFGLSSEYQNGRWHRLPEAPTHTSELYEPLRIVIDSIITHFGLSRVNGTRKAVNTHDHPFKRGCTSGFSLPDIAVKASGPSFSAPNGEKLGFFNTASCFAVKLDAEVTEASDHAAQMTAFANGAQYSTPVNIHAEPHTFTRIVLGLCTADERTLGLDDSVQWTVGSDGMESRGTLKTVLSDNTIITYDLVMNKNNFARRGLRGRGTICWVVQNDKKERFIVKDYWLAGGRIAECDLLKEARGLSGVCQMMSYEDDRSQTRDFRGDTSSFKDGAFHNRTAIRIVMKAYGPSVENFRSVEQLLAALRDAIAGHRALLAKNVIHRDVSPNNILLGPPNADKGDCGILIDLDIASKCDSPFDLIRADYKTGTRMFQSLMILKTSELDENDISAHDYLDDLESFFWVFSYLLLTYKSNGQLAPKNHLHKGIQFWPQDPYWSFDVKYTFLHSSCTDEEVEENINEGWRSSCLDLFVRFREYMSHLAREKKKRLFERGSDVEGAFPNRFSSILQRRRTL
ncbi:hypothetical protein MD484_g3715, partial [Candolleomyces efflorescens]